SSDRYTGQCRSQPLEAALTWLQNQCQDFLFDLDTDVSAKSPLDHRPLQTHLLTLWQQAPQPMPLALLCLRCFVSHAIRQACLQLVSQFGEYYQFRGADLFPLVLDDDGKPLRRYRPLGVHIIETFAPDKTSLESWASHLTRNHPELNQFLIEQGLYRVSDWAILNDTSPGQLPKILGDFHTLTPGEVAVAQQLLQRYHQVYRRDRLQQRQSGKGRRCQTPSEAQLREIDATVAPSMVLAQLRQLAYWLRQYRIHIRGGTPLAESLEALENSDLPTAVTHDADTRQADFLHTYRQQIEGALAEAMTHTLTAYSEKLRRKQPAKEKAFLKALALFHCQGQSMKAIAPQVGLKTQVQVTRLMNLKRFRSDVRNALLTHLQEKVQASVLAVTSAEHLAQISDRLDALLAEDADRLIEAAESEAKIPHNRTASSLFARQLCQCLQAFSSP
ncbi:MAG: hypothetical protein F6K42_35990, partial [Leptolyngbya sp. SIO1D8]|nr:hypothetical protein [Leptolyngbya sp. SIO1D8]